MNEKDENITVDLITGINNRNNTKGEIIVIVVYTVSKIASANNDIQELEILPKENVGFHMKHAVENEGRVLFTVANKAPNLNYFYQNGVLSIHDFIIRNSESADSIAVKFKIVACGNYDSGDKPPIGFSTPSIWKDEDKSKRTWFALELVNDSILTKDRIDNEYVALSPSDDFEDSRHPKLSNHEKRSRIAYLRKK